MSGTAGAVVGVNITRVLDAPRDLVFDAWTDPAQFAVWFGGEAPVPLDTVAMDVRAGGAWRATILGGPDGQAIPFSGLFVEVERASRLVFTMNDPMDPSSPNIETVMVTFTEVDGGTRMVFTQTGGNLSAEQYEATTHGWGLFFDRLAAHLARA